MKIKVSEATSLQLDWLVAKAESYTEENRGLMKRIHIFTGAHVGLFRMPKSTVHLGAWYKPSRDWSQAGRIIEREHIAIDWSEGNLWVASADDHPGCYSAPAPLIAAMRCYVASKLGEEVEVPDELA